MCCFSPCRMAWESTSRSFCLLVLTVLRVVATVGGGVCCCFFDCVLLLILMVRFFPRSYGVFITA
ncbi:hypothetical protein [Pasteuria penetrans]|uniref:hypothetical protein n=1 Tax=Pasteuria penetrans TaxID=86005 RepID=UPI000FB011B9|nr:hypothetical protein [Pasteuria penetrans]